MIIRSKAPLRLGMAGGGTDVSPYCDRYGGNALNATIDMYTHCTIEETEEDHIVFTGADIQREVTLTAQSELPATDPFALHVGTYNRIVRDYHHGRPLRLHMTTHSDALPGSGLGSSSAMVVAMVKAYAEWLHLPLGEYEIGQLAYEIERHDLGIEGGKQDQYAATFGGFNFMEFMPNDVVIVDPLRIKRWIVDELEASLILYFTGVSRASADIIREQQNNTRQGNADSVEAMHAIRASATEMKTALLRGDVKQLASILGDAWHKKKKMASKISNPQIDGVYDAALRAGAWSGKVSGAGGGGYMFFLADPLHKPAVARALQDCGGTVRECHFSEGGCHGWRLFNQF